MLIGLCLVKDSWANEGGVIKTVFLKNGFQTVWQDTVLYRSTLLFGRVLLFYPFEKKKGILKKL